MIPKNRNIAFKISSNYEYKMVLNILEKYIDKIVIQKFIINFSERFYTFENIKYKWIYIKINDEFGNKYLGLDTKEIVNPLDYKYMDYFIIDAKTLIRQEKFKRINEKKN